MNPKKISSQKKVVQLDNNMYQKTQHILDKLRDLNDKIVTMGMCIDEIIDFIDTDSNSNHDYHTDHNFSVDRNEKGINSNEKHDSFQ